MIKLLFQTIKTSWNNISRRQKVFVLATFFVSAISVLVLITPAFAQGTTPTPTEPFRNLNLGPDWLLGLLTTLMLALTRFALDIMLFILTFVIQIASYNGFLQSDAVNVGWVLVRDLTNMIFVVVLLMIAFGTILGIENYEWKSMLFKLVSAAILVNFSRIIAGVIIDIAQVVMITFVNGIAATAGGNFIQAFSLDSIRSFSENNNITINTEAVFLASMASLFISVTIMVTTGVLLAMLVVRVLILWVLIVLSPVAFALSVLPKTQAYAKQWWDEFGKNVITGPVLIFFLWLTLVTVGNGTIHQHFSTFANVSESNRINATNDRLMSQNAGIGKATSWSNLVNFVIAVGMLMVGIKVTQQLGGYGAAWTGKAVDWGKKVALTASGAYAARWGVQKAGEKIGAGAQLAKEWAGKQAYARFGGAALEGMYYSARSRYIDRRRENLSKIGKLAKEAYGVNEITGEPESKGWRKAWAKTKLAFSKEGATLQTDRVEKAKKAMEKREEIAADHTLSTSGLDYGYDNLKVDTELKKRGQYGLEIKAGKEAKYEGRFTRALDLLMDEEKAIAESTNNPDFEFKMEDVLADPDLMQDLRSEGINSSNDLKFLMENHTRRKKGADGKAEGDNIKGEMTASEERRHARAEAVRSADVPGTKMDEKIASFQAETRQIREHLTTDTELKLLTAIKNLLESQPGESEQVKIAKVMGDRDYAKLETEQKNLLLRAEAARQKNQHVLANQLEQQSNSLLINKIQEGFKSANFNANERANIVGSLAEEAQALQQRRGALNPDELKLLKNYTQQQVALMAVNGSFSAYDAQEAMRRGLQKLNWNEDWTNENTDRRVLSLMLGRAVQNGDEANALNELLQAFDGDRGRLSAALRQVGISGKNQLSQGNRDYAIIEELAQRFGKTDYDIKRGRPPQRAPISDDELAKHISDTLFAWKEGGDLNVGKMKQAIGDRSADGGKLIRIKIEPARGVNEAALNATFLKGLNSNSISRLEGGLLGDINDSLLSAADLKAQLDEFAKQVKDEDAFEAVLKKLDKVISRSGISQADLDDSKSKAD